MKSGLHITLNDPENQTNVIHAQFATARTNPELKQVLQDIADLDVKENIALKKLSVASEKLASAQSQDEIDEMAKSLRELRKLADDTTVELLDATMEFVVKGFELAGASRIYAEQLANCVGMEKINELKAKCLFGAGCLDFTNQGARI